MAKAKTMVGARAKVYVDNVLVGIFDSVDYTVNIGTEGIFLLGRYSAAEIVPTSYEIVTANCSGFRLIGNGAHVLPKMPKLQDLLNLETVTLAITDRQSPANAQPILTVMNCIPSTHGTGYSAKSTSRLRVTYQGISASDESGAQDEGDAVNLP
jgi:hypothetical protein